MNLFSIILVLLLSFFPGSAPYTAKGKATYYADRMHGHATNNGERYDKTKLTAAHATLPFNTLLQVTNTKNGKSVVVRINDRKARNSKIIIDLSRAAAKEIDLIRYGVVNVTLTEITDNTYRQQEAIEPVPSTIPNLSE